MATKPTGAPVKRKRKRDTSATATSEAQAEPRVTLGIKFPASPPPDAQPGAALYFDFALAKPNRDTLTRAAENMRRAAGLADKLADAIRYRDEYRNQVLSKLIEKTSGGIEATPGTIRVKQSTVTTVWDSFVADFNARVDVAMTAARRDAHNTLDKQNGIELVSGFTDGAITGEPGTLNDVKRQLLNDADFVEVILTRFGGAAADTADGGDTIDFMADVPRVSMDAQTILTVLLQGKCFNHTRGLSYPQIATIADGDGGDVEKYRAAGKELQSKGLLEIGRGRTPQHHLTERGACVARRYESARGN